jgi:hypothetical protein
MHNRLTSEELTIDPMSHVYQFIEGSLEVKLPTIWRDEKAVSREKRQKEKRSEERRCRCAKR